MATTWRIWLGVVVVCLSGRAQLSGSQPLSSSRLLKCTARADALGEKACAFPCQLAEFGLSEIAGGSISAQLVVAKPLATCEGPVDAAKGDIRNDEHAHSYEEPPHHHPNALLIGRGGCSFATKALLGRDAYRAAVVIIANTDDDVFPMAGQVDERLNSTLVLMISSGARDRLLKSKSSAPVEATPLVVEVQDEYAASADDDEQDRGEPFVESTLDCAASFRMASDAHRQHQWAVARKLYKQCSSTCSADSAQRLAAFCNLGALEFLSGQLAAAVGYWHAAIEATLRASASECLPIEVATEHNLEVAGTFLPSRGTQEASAEDLWASRLRSIGATTIGVDVALEAWLLRRRAHELMHGASPRNDASLRSFQALEAKVQLARFLGTTEIECRTGKKSLSLAMPTREPSTDLGTSTAITRALDMACTLFLMRKTCNWRFLDIQLHKLMHEATRFVNAGAKAVQSSTNVARSPWSLSELCGPIIPGMGVPLWLLNRACMDKSNEMLPSTSGRSHGAAFQKNADDKDARMRIGYMSPNLFNHHPVGKQLLPLIALHNRSRFFVHCFCIDTASNHSCGAFSWCEKTVILEAEYEETGLNMNATARERAFADTIVAHGIQVLVDVTGHTVLGVAMRVLAYAKNSIPVVIHFHDTPTPYASGRGLGAPFVDFFLSDSTSVGAIEHWDSSSHERLISIPHEFWVAPRAKPVDDFLTGHSQYGTRFCNLGRHEKLSPETLDLWSNVLLYRPASTLLLFSGTNTSQLRLCHEFEARGIHCTSRVRFQEHVNYAKLNSALSSRCDLYLDSPEYNSISLGADSLRAGVPVLTLLGEHHHGRMAAAIVNAAEMKTLVVNQAKEYTAVALRVANCTSAAEGAISPLKYLQQKLKKDLTRIEPPSVFSVRTVARWIESIAFQSSWEVTRGNMDTRHAGDALYQSKRKHIPHIWGGNR